MYRSLIVKKWIQLFSYKNYIIQDIEAQVLRTYTISIPYAGDYSDYLASKMLICNIQSVKFHIC